jgi:hypothetical protein
MVSLAEVLVVGGSALVVCSAIWAWSAIEQRLLRGTDQALGQPPQPPQPSRKIYPPPCKQCSGKGRLARVLK